MADAFRLTFYSAAVLPKVQPRTLHHKRRLQPLLPKFAVPVNADQQTQTIQMLAKGSRKLETKFELTPGRVSATSTPVIDVFRPLHSQNPFVRKLSPVLHRAKTYETPRFQSARRPTALVKHLA